MSMPLAANLTICFFSFSFFAPILFEALCMVCKFFTWPHFCILCGNTLEASGRLGSYPVRAVKITKRWLRRRTTDDKVCEKAIQLAVNQLTRLEDSTTSHSAHSAAASSPPSPPFSPFLFLFCWLAIWLRHIEVRVRSNMQSSRATWSWHSFKCVINLCCAGKCLSFGEWGRSGAGERKWYLCWVLSVRALS